MSKIVGYTTKNLPKWPFVLIGLVFLCGLILYLLVTSYDENNKPVVLTTSTLSTSTTTTTIPKITTTILKTSTTSDIVTTTLQSLYIPSEMADITVEQIVFARGIEKHRPVGNFKKIKKDEVARVYCYSMVIALAVPQEIRHVWLDPKGNQIADIYLTISNQPGYTWSYVNLSEYPAGKWQVQVKDFAGTTLAKSDFIIE